jgi:hypothetical protein
MYPNQTQVKTHRWYIQDVQLQEGWEQVPKLCELLGPFNIVYKVVRACVHDTRGEEDDKKQRGQTQRERECDYECEGEGEGECERESEIERERERERETWKWTWNVNVK